MDDRPTKTLLDEARSTIARLRCYASTGKCRGDLDNLERQLGELGERLCRAKPEWNLDPASTGNRWRIFIGGGVAVVDADTAEWYVSFGNSPTYNATGKERDVQASKARALKVLTALHKAMTEALPE